MKENKDVEKVSIAESFRIQQPFAQENTLNGFLTNITETYLSQITDSWDNFCIDKLYEEYKKCGVTKLFVINREEFKRFLLWALPLYYEKVKKMEEEDEKQKANV